MKRGVKSFTISEEQYQLVEQRRAELIVIDGESVVMGRPHRDFLEVHYAFPEVEAFVYKFKPMFERMTAASSKAEAPRGVVLAFRDRPNRPKAEQLFWESALEEGKHWVEADYNAVPEQPEPENAIAGGYTVREATPADRGAIADIEAESTGLPRLSEAGVDSVYESARWLRLVTDGAGKPVAWLGLRREPGGWGLIEELFILPSEVKAVREPALRWASAFLRNNGGRRQRRRVNLDDTEELALLRSLGFAPAESGVDYERPVDRADIQAKVDERQAHGTLIKFGDWR
jgi:hypothetical protein